jgi:hypothetical protein
MIMKMTEVQLYVWASRQRTLYNQGRLEPRRVILLEKIPGWTWTPEEDSWNQKYELSKKYGMVECKFITPDGVLLGIWQRNMRSNGGDNKFMTPERKKLLEKIPGWTWNKEDASWNQKYELSKKYGVVSRSFTPDGIQLGVWQGHMRSNGGDNKYMTPERKKLLEKIPGWKWRYTPQEIGAMGVNNGKSKARR